MEDAITGIFTTGALVFSVVIALATVAVRKVVETVFKKLEIVIPDKAEDLMRDFWKQWVLRALPMILGGLAAYMFQTFPVPEVFAESTSGRVFFGIVAGLFSMPLYDVVKYHTKKHLPESVKEKVTSIIPKMPPKED